MYNFVLFFILYFYRLKRHLLLDRDGNGSVDFGSNGSSIFDGHLGHESRPIDQISKTWGAVIQRMKFWSYSMMNIRWILTLQHLHLLHGNDVTYRVCQILIWVVLWYVICWVVMCFYVRSTYSTLALAWWLNDSEKTLRLHSCQWPIGRVGHG